MLNIEIHYTYDLELNIEDYNTIPNNLKGVYMFFDWDNNLLYVGLSGEIKKRLYAHLRVPDSYMYPYRTLIRYLKIVKCNDKLFMNLLETYLINTLYPPLNMDIKLRKYENKAIDDSYIKLSKEYESLWMNEVYAIMVDNDYNKRSKIDNYINLINKLNFDEPLPISKVSQSFRRYLNKHYEDKKDFIDEHLNKHGYILVSMKDRYSSNSKYIMKK